MEVGTRVVADPVTTLVVVATGVWCAVAAYRGSLARVADRPLWLGALLLGAMGAALASPPDATAAPVVTLAPACGPADGEPHSVDVVGTGFGPGEVEALRFVDTDGGVHQAEVGPADEAGALRAVIVVSANEGTTLISLGSAVASFAVPCPESVDIPETPDPTPATTAPTPVVPVTLAPVTVVPAAVVPAAVGPGPAGPATAGPAAPVGISGVATPIGAGVASLTPEDIASGAILALGSTTTTPVATPPPAGTSATTTPDLAAPTSSRGGSSSTAFALIAALLAALAWLLWRLLKPRPPPPPALPWGEIVWRRAHLGLSVASAPPGARVDVAVFADAAALADQIPQSAANRSGGAQERRAR